MALICLRHCREVFLGKILLNGTNFDLIRCFVLLKTGFFIQSILNIEKAVIIDKPLYHYFTKQRSAINSFRPANKLGAEKSLYILDKFLSVAKKIPIEKRKYESGMSNIYYGQLKMIFCYL